MTKPRRITRRRFVQGAVAGGALGAACDTRGLLSGRGSRPPNLVVLVTDDQRPDSLGYSGNPVVKTPVLDGLAANGTVFDEAFVTTSVCPVSRASIFTGQYMRRHGVRDFSKALSPTGLATSCPVQLRNAGYRTGFFGKWGLGGLRPNKAFDVFDGFAGSGRYTQNTPSGPRHLTGMIAELAADFVKTGPPDRPFCAWVSFKAPHGPWWEYPKTVAHLYNGESIPLPATASLEAFDRLPSYLRASMGSTTGNRWVTAPHKLRRALRDYYRMVTVIDLAVARLLEAVAEAGVENETVILFTSDNGILIGEHGLSGKWLMFEESIRIPLLIHDPRAPASARGRRVDAMALNIDVAPTLLDLAGVPIPETVQGQSLVPWVEGESPEWRRDWFYEYDFTPYFGYVPKLEGVREANWKYVRYLDDRSKAETLYDLAADPMELDDLASDPAHVGELERLRARWQVLRDEVS